MSAQDLDQGQGHAHHSTEGDEQLDSATELDQLLLYTLATYKHMYMHQYHTSYAWLLDIDGY